jgi:hypothetical protein
VALAALAVPPGALAGGLGGLHPAAGHPPLPGALVPAGLPAPPVVPVASGGLAALAKALGGSPNPPGVSTDVEVARVDQRVLPVQYDNSGLRFREFRSAVSQYDNITFPDWPIPGNILTTTWCCKFMLARAGSPTGWHQMWVSLGKLNPQDHHVMYHGDLCRIIEVAVCYDQLDAPSLASLELLFRQIQVCEDALKHKFANSAGSSDSTFDRHLMAGTSSNSSLCICPALMEWMSHENSKSSSIEKERRKAREERTLILKDSNKSNKGKNAKDDTG